MQVLCSLAGQAAKQGCACMQLGYFYPADDPSLPCVDVLGCKQTRWGVGC